MPPADRAMAVLAVIVIGGLVTVLTAIVEMIRLPYDRRPVRKQRDPAHAAAAMSAPTELDLLPGGTAKEAPPARR